MSNRTEWNHRYDGPIAVNPLWTWPVRPMAVLRWYWDSWFFFSVSLAIVGLAWAAYAVTSPTLVSASEPGTWMVIILLRNWLLAGTLAGGCISIFIASGCRATI